jgi:hypothetical protein
MDYLSNEIVVPNVGIFIKFSLQLMGQLVLNLFAISM